MIIKKRYLLIFFCLIFAIGCTEPSVIKDQKAKMIYLQGEDTEISLEGVFRPQASACIFRNLLILLDGMGEYQLKIIDLEKKKLVGAYFKRGRGPGEVGFIGAISSIPDEPDFIILLDINYRKLYFIQPLEVIKGKDYYPVVRKLYSEAASYSNIFALTNSRYAAIGTLIDSDKRIVILDKDLNLLDFHVDYPLPEDIREGLSNRLIGGIFHFNAAVRPDGERIASSLGNSDYIDIIDLTGNEPEIIYKEGSDWPLFKVTGPGSYYHIDYKCHIYNVKATNKYIYWLYPEDPKDPFINRLILTDWNGKVKHKYSFDVPVRTVAVTHDDTYLYGFTAPEMDQGRQRLIKYELKK